MRDRFDEILQIPLLLMAGQFDSIFALEASPEFGIFVRDLRIPHSLRFGVLASVVRAKALCCTAEKAISCAKAMYVLLLQVRDPKLAEQVDALRYEILLSSDDSKARLEGWLYQCRLVIHFEESCADHDLAWWFSLLASQLLRGLVPAEDSNVNVICGYMRRACASLVARLSADKDVNGKSGLEHRARKEGLVLALQAFQVFYLLDPETAKQCDGLRPEQSDMRCVCGDALSLSLYLRPSLLHQMTIMCHRLECDPTLAVQAFLAAVREWRGQLGQHELRSGLRRSLAWQCNQVIECCRQRVGSDDEGVGELLAEAVDTLGPGRWLEEKITHDRESTHRGTPKINTGMSEWQHIFQQNGTILQVDPAGDDLWLIATKVGLKMPVHSLGVRKLSQAAKQLRELREEFHREIASVQKELKSLRVVPDEEVKRKYKACCGRLHKLAYDLAGDVGKILGDGLSEPLLPRGEDVLIVCADPKLLALPWSLVKIGHERLIQRVRSLTLNISVGAAAALADRPQVAGDFDIAAYCHDKDKNGNNPLHWDRLLFDRHGKECGLSKLAQSRGITLRTVGIEKDDRQVADIATLAAYFNDGAECNVLLVAGHGDPEKGIHLKDGYWKPSMKGDWRGTKTECAMLPSCRIGEMRWDSRNDDGENDPSKSEIVGFTASLCVTGIPRVLACPWVCYDLPVCQLIPLIVGKAIEKRKQQEPHYWARALHDVIVERLNMIVADPKKPKGFGYYDLANLMLFGAP